MTRLQFVLLTLVGALLLCCAPAVRVKTAFQPGTDFQRYRSFAMMEPNRPVASENAKVSPFILQRLRQLTYIGLKDRGLSPVSKEQADLLVAVTAAHDERVEVYSTGYYADPFYGGRGRSDVRHIQEGLVVIDLVDRSTNSVVWRGTGVRSTGDEMDEARMRELVFTVLAAYPGASGTSASSPAAPSATPAESTKAAPESAAAPAQQ